MLAIELLAFFYINNIEFKNGSKSWRIDNDADPTYI